MADIICARCGEPWDTGHGLHWQNSDLEEGDYNNLISGFGCPCCESKLSEFEYTEAEIAENIEAWQRSIEYFDEGVGEYEYHSDNVRPRCETEQLD